MDPALETQSQPDGGQSELVRSHHQAHTVSSGRPDYYLSEELGCSEIRHEVTSL